MRSALKVSPMAKLPVPAIWRLPVLAVCLTVVLAACTGTGATPSASAETAASPSSEPAGSEPAASDGAVTLPPPEVTDLAIGHSGFGSVGGIVGELADELDLFANYGLNVEQHYFEGDAQNLQAYQAGQVDIVNASGLPIITSLKTDQPLVSIFVNHSLLTDVLVVSPDIETAEDLVGKSVAVSGFGALSHAQVILALEELGLNPDDVTITPLGGGSARAAALAGGSVQAAPLDPGELIAMEPLGFHSLINMAELEGVGIQRTGLAVPRTFAEENPNTTLALAAAYAEAISILLNDPGRAVEAWSGVVDITPEEAAEQLEAEFAYGYEPRDGRAQPQWFEAAYNALVQVDPELEQYDWNDAFTTEFVDQLEELGLYEELGLPADVPTEVNVP